MYQKPSILLFVLCLTLESLNHVNAETVAERKSAARGVAAGVTGAVGFTGGFLLGATVFTHLKNNGGGYGGADDYYGERDLVHIDDHGHVPPALYDPIHVDAFGAGLGGGYRGGHGGYRGGSVAVYGGHRGASGDGENFRGPGRSLQSRPEGGGYRGAAPGGSHRS